jgi:hypothetical protein
MSGVGDVHDTEDKDLMRRGRRAAVYGMRATSTASAAAAPTGARLSIFELRSAGHRLCDRPRQCWENVRFQKGVVFGAWVRPSANRIKLPLATM